MKIGEKVFTELSKKKLLLICIIGHDACTILHRLDDTVSSCLQGNVKLKVSPGFGAARGAA